MMELKYSLPWIGRLYRQRNEARRERDDALKLKATSYQAENTIASLFENLQTLVPPDDGSATSPRWRWDKYNFIRQLPTTGRLLDVGCGNNSPYWTKQVKPGWHYTGIDIEDYNQTSPNIADEYIITSPENFHKSIEELHDQFDAVICSHNLEHCLDRSKVLTAMSQALKPGGQIYLAFPCRESLEFPGGRNGSLNYFDDCTHLDEPPEFGDVISSLVSDALKIRYASTRYQPPLDWVNGMKNEEESVRARETKEGTWAYWGFETVIWAEKNGV